MAAAALVWCWLCRQCDVAGDKARHQEALERYAANISLADGSIRQGSTDLAFERLMQCPEQFGTGMGRLLFECLRKSARFRRIPTDRSGCRSP